MPKGKKGGSSTPSSRKGVMAVRKAAVSIRTPSKIAAKSKAALKRDPTLLRKALRANEKKGEPKGKLGPRNLLGPEDYPARGGSAGNRKLVRVPKPKKPSVTYKKPS